MGVSIIHTSHISRSEMIHHINSSEIDLGRRPKMDCHGHSRGHGHGFTQPLWNQQLCVDTGLVSTPMQLIVAQLNAPATADRYNADILQAVSTSPFKPFDIKGKFEPGLPPR